MSDDYSPFEISLQKTQNSNSYNKYANDFLSKEKLKIQAQKASEIQKPMRPLITTQVKVEEKPKPEIKSILKHQPSPSEIAQFQEMNASLSRYSPKKEQIIMEFVNDEIDENENSQG